MFVWLPGPFCHLGGTLRSLPMVWVLRSWRACPAVSRVTGGRTRQGGIPSPQVTCHELCHLLGLGNCRWLRCLMQGALSLEEVLRWPLDLCPICLRKLQYVVGFQLLDRYKVSMVCAAAWGVTQVSGRGSGLCGVMLLWTSRVSLAAGRVLGRGLAHGACPGPWLCWGRDEGLLPISVSWRLPLTGCLLCHLPSLSLACCHPEEAEVLWRKAPLPQVQREGLLARACCPLQAVWPHSPRCLPDASIPRNFAELRVQRRAAYFFSKIRLWLGAQVFSKG